MRCEESFVHMENVWFGEYTGEFYTSHGKSDYYTDVKHSWVPRMRVMKNLIFRFPVSNENTSKSMETCLRIATYIWLRIHPTIENMTV